MMSDFMCSFFSSGSNLVYHKTNPLTFPATSSKPPALSFCMMARKRHELVEVRPSDILSTFGYASVVQPGNVLFRNTIASMRSDFLLATEEDRTSLITSLLTQIKAESRFLAQKTDGTWRLLSDSEAMLRIRRQFQRFNNDAKYYSKKKAARQRRARLKYSAPRACRLSPSPPRSVPAPANKPTHRPKQVISRFGTFLASFLWVSFGQEYKELEKIAFNILRTLIFHEPHEPSNPGEGLVLTADRPYGTGPFLSCERKSYQRNTFADKINIPTHDPDTHIVAAYGTGTGRSTVGTPPRSVTHTLFAFYGIVRHCLHTLF